MNLDAPAGRSVVGSDEAVVVELETEQLEVPGIRRRIVGGDGVGQSSGHNQRREQENDPAAAGDLDDAGDPAQTEAPSVRPWRETVKSGRRARPVRLSGVS